MAVTTANNQQTKKDLESQIARLNKIGIALSSEHDLNRLLEMIVREARRFTNADGGSLGWGGPAVVNRADDHSEKGCPHI